jgi:hypothetical protein
MRTGFLGRPPTYIVCSSSNSNLNDACRQIVQQPTVQIRQSLQETVCEVVFFLVALEELSGVDGVRFQERTGHVGAVFLPHRIVLHPLHRLSNRSELVFCAVVDHLSHSSHVKKHRQTVFHHTHLCVSRRLFFNQNSLYRLHVERFVREDALQIHNQTRMGVSGDVDDFPFQDVQLRVENDVR